MDSFLDDCFLQAAKTRLAMIQHATLNEDLSKEIGREILAIENLEQSFLILFNAFKAGEKLSFQTKKKILTVMGIIWIQETDK